MQALRMMHSVAEGAQKGKEKHARCSRLGLIFVWTYCVVDAKLQRDKPLMQCIHSSCVLLIRCCLVFALEWRADRDASKTMVLHWMLESTVMTTTADAMSSFKLCTYTQMGTGSLSSTLSSTLFLSHSRPPTSWHATKVQINLFHGI